MMLNDAPFQKIKSGLKTIEMRLFDEKRQALHVGDELVFQNRDSPQDTLMTRIVGLHRFATFEEMTSVLAPHLMGYTPDWDARLAAGDHGMYAYYSREDEVRFGVLGIEVEVL